MRANFQIITGLFLLLLVVRCTYNEEVTSIDCSTQNLTLELVSKTDTRCNLAIGQVEVSASEGSGSYEYSLDGGDFQQNSVFENLSAGNYTVNVRDTETECTSELEIAILNEDGVSINISTTPAGCLADDGSISITASNGVEPYSYALDGGDFSSTTDFSDLPAGSYQVVVRDAEGCEAQSTATIEKDNSTASFSNDVAPIIANNCAISGCHGEGTVGRPELVTYEDISAAAGRVKARTSAGTMPPASRPELTADEIALIACWVDAGAPNN